MKKSFKWLFSLFTAIALLMTFSVASASALPGYSLMPDPAFNSIYVPSGAVVVSVNLINSKTETTCGAKPRPAVKLRMPWSVASSTTFGVQTSAAFSGVQLDGGAVTA